MAKEWFPNDEPAPIKGKIEFIQQTEYDVTNVEVDFEDLNNNSGYHVHIVSLSIYI